MGGINVDQKVHNQPDDSFGTMERSTEKKNWYGNKRNHDPPPEGPNSHFALEWRDILGL